MTQCRPAPARPARQGGAESGAATVLSLVLGLAFVVLPVLLLVLSIPVWEQRAVDARDAARAAARALAVSQGWPEGALAADAAARAVLSGDGVPADAAGLSLGGALVPGGQVTASVTVEVPAGALPWLGPVGNVPYTAASTQAVSPYRSGP